MAINTSLHFECFYNCTWQIIVVWSIKIQNKKSLSIKKIDDHVFIPKERKGTKMKIDVKQDGEIFVVELEGRMDTNTSPEFQKEMEAYYSKEGFNMILDFDKLDFVSSAGLRVLLLIQKKSKALSGSLVIKNVKPEIQEVFDMTGFSDILNIE